MKQKRIVHSQKKRPKTVSGEAQTLDLVDKNFKSAIFNMFIVLLETMDRDKIRKMNDARTNRQYQ